MNKSLLKDVSRLVLFTFLFQTLWPHFVWAATVEVAPSFSGSINTFKRVPEGTGLASLLDEMGLSEDSSSGSDAQTPKAASSRASDYFSEGATSDVCDGKELTLPRVHVGDESEVEEPTLSFHLSTLQDLLQWEAFQKEVQTRYPVYKNLRRLESDTKSIEGVLWEASGLQFVLMGNGDLCVSGGTETVDFLSLKNTNGCLVLAENLQVKRLFAKALNVTYTGKKSEIETLEVHAADKEGVFSIEESAHLSVKNFVLQAGRLHNRGQLSVLEKGVMRLAGHDLLNDGAITLKTEASLRDVNALTNASTGQINGAQESLIAAKTLKNVHGAKIEGIHSLRFDRGENEGVIKSEELDFEVREHFKNAMEGMIDVGTLVTFGAGRIEQKGAFDVKTLRIDNAEFEDTSGWEHTFTDVIIDSAVRKWTLGVSASDTPSTWTTKTFTIERGVRPCFQNKGVLVVNDTFRDHGNSFFNYGDLTAKHMELGQGGHGVFVNEKEGSVEVGTDAVFDAEMIANKGSWTVKRETTGKVTRFINTGGITFEDVSLEGNEFTNESAINVTSRLTWEGQTFSGSKGSKLFATEMLDLKVKERFKHLGNMRTMYFYYAGDAALVNEGTLQATEASSIASRFENTVSGSAELVGLTLAADARMALVNQGQLVLKRVESLGKDAAGKPILREIVNGAKGNTKAKLLVQESGVTSGKTRMQKGAAPAANHLLLGAVTNYGTIGFGQGAYHIQGVFANHGVHDVLAGQALQYVDLDNYGEIQSKQAYEIDHTRGCVKKLGKVRVTGELHLLLGDKANAADVLRHSDIYSETKTIVEAQNFINTSYFSWGPDTLQLHGNWELRTKYFRHEGKLLANQLKIVSDNLKIGSSNEKLGTIWVIKDDKKQGAQDNSLTLIQRQGTLYLEYASLFGEGVTTLTAEEGGVILGDKPVERKKTSHMDFLPPDWDKYHNDDPLFGEAHHPHFACMQYFPTYEYPYYHPGGASLASNSNIFVNAARGYNIKLGYTTVEGKGTLTLSAPQGTITNFATRVLVPGDIRVTADRFNNTTRELLRIAVYDRAPTQHPTYDGQYYADYNDYRNYSDYYACEDFAQAAIAELISRNGSILFEVDHLENNASKIMAACKITNYGVDHKRLLGKTFLNTSRAKEVHHNKMWPIQDPRTHVYAQDPGVFQAGEQVSVAFSTQTHKGFVGGQSVTLTGDLATLEGFLGAATSAGGLTFLKRYEQLHPELQGLIKAMQDHLAQSSSLLQRKADGALDYAVPLADANTAVREKKRTTLPVFEGAAAAGVPFYAPGDMDLEAFQQASAEVVGKMYATTAAGNIYGDALFWSLLQRGFYYAQKGSLTKARLREIKDPILFYRPYRAVHGNSLLVLEYYCPQKDRAHGDDGKAAITGDKVKATFGQMHLHNAKVIGGKGGVDVSVKETLDMRNTLLESDGDLSLRAKNLSVAASTLRAGKDLNITVEEQARLVSVVERMHSAWNGHENFHDILHKTLVEAGGNLKIVADVLAFSAIETRSGTNDGTGGTLFQYGKSFVDAAAALTSQHTERWKRGFSQTTCVQHVVSDHRSGSRGTTIQGEGAQVHQAPSHHSLGDVLLIGSEVDVEAVYNTIQTVSESRRGGGFFRSSSTSSSHSFTSDGVGADLKAKNVLMIATEADVTVKGTRVAAETLRVLALQGAAKFLAVSHHHEYHRQASSSDGFVQQSRAHGSSATTHEACVLPEDTEAVAEAGAVIEAVRDQLPGWVDRIRIVRPDGSAAAKAVITLDNVYTRYDMSAKSLSTGVSAVITLAITLATQGTGTAFGLSGTAATVSMAASSAALGSLCSAAALQLVQCNGNLVKAASGLLSTGVLEGVVKASATAGAVPAGMAGNTFSERLVSGFVNGVQRGAIRSLFGDKFDIKEVALSAGVNAAGATVASQIGKAYGDELINGVSHKVLHGALGGATGFALGGTGKSAAAGSFGAVVAETLVEITAETTDALSGRVVNRLEEEGLAPTEENIRSITRAEMQRTMDLGKMGAAIAALFAGQDVNMAAFTATTAVENNAAQAAAIAVMASPHFAALLAGAGLSAAWLTQYQQQKMGAKAAAMDGADTDGFVDEGLTTEEAKPKVTTTPAHEGPSSSLPGYAAHDDPLPFAEGFDAYDGPDARVLEKTLNQIDQEIRRGQAPRGIDKLHKPHIGGNQIHVHFDNGAALNRDGTWKEGHTKLTKDQKDWLLKNGWSLPHE